MNNHPPSTLDSAIVLSFAVVDNDVAYENRKTLYVNGELLGAVPKLAICQNPDESEVMVFHCDRDWNVLGVSGHASVLKALQKVELSYKGLLQKWVQV
jgi:hypothetical protein